MTDSPNEPKPSAVWRDPFILLGSAVTAFGLIGIVDTAITWRGFFQDFFGYWTRFRDVVFSIFPFDIPSDFKDLIIINCAAASIMLRSAYIVNRRSTDAALDLRIVTIVFAGFSSLYALLWPAIWPIREYIQSWVVSIAGNDRTSFISGVLGSAVDTAFLCPLIGLILYLGHSIYDGFRNAPAGSDERSVSVTILSTTMIVFGFVAALMVFCVRW